MDLEEKKEKYMSPYHDYYSARFESAIRDLINLRDLVEQSEIDSKLEIWDTLARAVEILLILVKVYSRDSDLTPGYAIEKIDLANLYIYQLRDYFKGR